MLTTLVLCLCCPQVSDPIDVQAALGPRSEAGERELRIDFQLSGGWSVPRLAMLPAAEPAALLQLDPPPDLDPIGFRPSSLREQLQALFLDGPEERLLEERGARVVVVNQEDTGEESRWKRLEALGGDPPFVLASDVDRRATARFERITTYVLDPEGRVVEIFPAHRRVWMPWDAVLNRLDELALAGRTEER